MNELVNCSTPRCGAKFNPTVRWFYGWRDPDGTANDFEMTGKIPLGHCPICRKLQKNERAA
jgi:hypothetical protein